MAFNFFKINSNYSEKDLDHRSKILSDLYFFRGSLATVENDHGKNGRYASRYVAYQTTLAIVPTFCIGGLITLFFSNSTGLYIGLCFLLLLIWWLLPNWLIAKENNDEDSLPVWISQMLTGVDIGIKDKFRFIIWRFFICISPFSLRTVWIWSLIFGLYISLKNIHLTLCFGCGFSFAEFDQFSIDFLKTLIIVILSYIATNIISELLNLREEYVKSSDSVKQVTIDISQSIKNLKDDLIISNDLVNEVSVNIKNQKFFEPLQKEYEKFQQTKAFKYIIPNDNLNKSFEKYSELLSDQIGILSERLTGDSVIDLWLLTGLKSAAELRVSQIEEKNSITTLFEIFGNLIADCLDNFDVTSSENNTEIYTVFALPPDRFLNYNESDSLSNYWINYLNTNIKTVNRCIKVHRHFLSFINKRATIEKFAGIEGVDLMHQEVIEKWNENYLINSDGTPYFNTNLKRFQKAVESNGDQSLKSKSLIEIIASIYHCQNCCKLLRVDLKKNWEDVLYSKKYKKPIDYFALKSITNNKWIFCFKTYYDKTFNAAIVELWHENKTNHDDWENIKKELDRLFTHNPINGIEIEDINYNT